MVRGASSYTQATWQTPVMPADATAISFGLSMFNNGTIVTDDLGLVEAGPLPRHCAGTTLRAASGATTPPLVSSRAQETQEEGG